MRWDTKEKHLSESDIQYIKENIDKKTADEMAEYLGWNKNTFKRKILNLFGKSKGRVCKCPICGTEFRSIPQRIYCSKECSKQHEAAVARERSVLPHKKYASYLWGAKSRAYEFSLTFEEFMTFWNVDCTYCGDQIDTIGLDRMDNRQGYTLSNVVPCCSVCNYMKQGLSVEQFMNHVNKIIGRQV